MPGESRVSVTATLAKLRLAGPRSYSDLVLVFGVVAIVALMILPLPMEIGRAHV